jgi:Ca2+-binding RTX toxin-like protein
LAGTQLVDSITGGDGDDVINGGAGADTLLAGGAGDDEIYGGDGEDTIDGGDGADTIEGGAGVDYITGGLGLDTMTGGDGNDVFVFDTSADSGIGAAARDVILDFTEAGIAGGDLIDLGNIAGMSFIGTDQFSANAQGGEIRYTVIGGNSIVEVSVVGNGITDFQIQINNTDVLAASDFVLI